MFKLQTATSCDCAPTPCTTCCAVGHCSLSYHHHAAVHCSLMWYHCTIVHCSCHVTVTPGCAAPHCVIPSRHGVLLPVVLLSHWGALLPNMSPSHHCAGVYCSLSCHHHTVMLGCAAPHCVMPWYAAPHCVAIVPSHWGALLPNMSPLHCHAGVHCSLSCCHCTIVLRCAAPCCVAIVPLCWGVLLLVVLPSHPHAMVCCSPSCCTIALLHHCVLLPVVLLLHCGALLPIVKA